MAGLARVASAVAQFFYRDSCFIRGQFTGNNNAANTLIKVNGLATVARTGEGTYTFTLLANDGVTALKGFHLKDFRLTCINPNAADGGSGTVIITADALNASGTINFTTNHAAGAAADILVVAKLAVEISPEAAS